MKTIMPKQLPLSERKWYIIDAKGKNLGRLASFIAPIIRGKNKVSFSPHMDNGDYVIVLNAGEITVTGAKEEQKLYRSHSQYLGGLKEIPLSRMRKNKPTEIVRHAVLGMLPKNKLQNDMIQRLKLERGSTHGYEAQKPEILSF